jgi:outer membrane lipoprotein SlyB
MKTVVRIGMAGVALALLNACAPSLSGSSYTRDQAQREQNVRMGVVESVRQVQIEGTRSGVGPAAGAVVGGVAGSNVGHGRGAAVGAVLGSVAGGVAGQAAEQAATRQPGLEITVKLDSGRMIAVTQAADENFRPGDRVRVLSDGRTARVTH